MASRGEDYYVPPPFRGGEEGEGDSYVLTHASFNKKKASVSGFTLLELIVVLFLISLIAGISVVLFTGTLSSGRLDATARNLIAAMKHARALSSMNGEPQAVFIDLDSGTYGIEGKGSRQLPDGITASVTEPFAGIAKSGRHLILFHPVGSIEGGTIILSTPKRAVAVRPDPLVAAVSEKIEAAQ
jgi:prepilin-type N-terminal cleavage/methylation domain-containing protein